MYRFRYLLAITFEAQMTPLHYPNETSEYRLARDQLLKEELALRAQVERVAQHRRALPPGGLLKEDYEFAERLDGKDAPVRFSELFAPGKDTLFLYSFMYSPDMAEACPMCSAFLDGLHGQVIHLEPRINVAVVAKHSLEKIHEHAASRGWDRFRLLSSAGNAYNKDYFGETDSGQTTMANVFVRNGDEIRHFWGTEMSFADPIEGGNMRHVDLAWPMWNVLDMTPSGRGEQFYPALNY
jgi:predicted dithiol-disulfide oxidoreductase (DUF899 family)